MPTPLQVADEALAAHTKHIGGMVNALGELHDKLEASHEYEYQRGFSEGYSKAQRGFSEGYSKALQNVFAACGINIQEIVK